MVDDHPIEKMTIQEIMDLLGKQEGILAFIEKGILEEIPLYYRNRIVVFYKKEK